MSQLRNESVGGCRGRFDFIKVSSNCGDFVLGCPLVVEDKQVNNWLEDT